MKCYFKTVLSLLLLFSVSSAMAQIYPNVPQRRSYQQLDVNALANSLKALQIQEEQAFNQFNSLLVAAKEAFVEQDYDFALIYLRQCEKINERYEFCPQSEIREKIDLCLRNKQKEVVEEMQEDNSGNVSKNVRKHSKWTGTGFAIDKEYIVTNYHVINNATQIKIYGINGDISKYYSAVVKAVDKDEDLAILKVQNIASPNGLGIIPYGFDLKSKDVGDNIYVLGYPLTESMGRDI